MTARAATPRRIGRPQMRVGSPRSGQVKRFWEITAQNVGDADAPSAEIRIYGIIGQDENWNGDRIGISAQAFLDELRSLDPNANLTVRINSRGGDVFDGSAIHALLSAHKGRKTVVIDGIAASAASLIAMAGDEIHIPANAWMMIHDPSSIAIGTATDMRAGADMLDSIKAGVVSTYAAKSGLTPEAVAAAMTATTWYTGQQAVDAGFANTCVGAVKVTNLAPAESGDVALSVYGDLPPELAAAMEAATGTVDLSPAEAAMQAIIDGLKAQITEMQAKGSAGETDEERVAREAREAEEARRAAETEDERKARETAEAAAAETARVENLQRTKLRQVAVNNGLDDRFDELVGIGASMADLRELVVKGSVAMASKAPTHSVTVPPPGGVRQQAGGKVDLHAKADGYYARINNPRS